MNTNSPGDVDDGDVLNQDGVACFQENFILPGVVLKKSVIEVFCQGSIFLN